MSVWEFDLDLLYESIDGWIPLTVRYGNQKISDFACKTDDFPAVAGTLWERVTS